MSKRIEFEKPLIEGVVVSRPNRYVTFVRLTDGSEVRCFTPVGGRIGGYTIDGLRCLISGPYVKRTTAYTVEALRFTNQWVGINQNSSNKFVEEFMRRGFLNELHGGEQLTVARERSLGSSRIDFRLESATQASWVEVKTPLIKLHVEAPEGLPLKTDFGSGGPSARMPKQLNDMLKLKKPGERAILLGAFFYKNEIGSSKERYLANLDVDGMSTLGAEEGLESWEVNLAIDAEGVTFLDVERII